MLKGKVNYSGYAKSTFNVLFTAESNEKHLAFSDLKFILKHPTVIESLIFFSSKHPTCHEYVMKAEISRISGYPHPVIFRTSGPSRNTRPPRIGEQPLRAPPSILDDLLHFCFPATARPPAPPSLSSSFRGRRWKRWLRGTEKLIISDTNLSGLLGGW